MTAKEETSPLLPDFDAYPTDRRLVEAEPATRCVHARWDDGLECRYHVFWLRENAPDAETTHPVTREQALQLVNIRALAHALNVRLWL